MKLDANVREVMIEASKGMCYEHWRYEPIVCGGIEHCGWCGAIMGDIQHLTKQWIRGRKAMNLVGACYSEKTWREV